MERWPGTALDGTPSLAEGTSCQCLGAPLRVNDGVDIERDGMQMD